MMCNIALATWGLNGFINSQSIFFSIYRATTPQGLMEHTSPLENLCPFWSFDRNHGTIFLAKCIRIWLSEPHFGHNGVGKHHHHHHFVFFKRTRSFKSWVSDNISNSVHGTNNCPYMTKTVIRDFLMLSQSSVHSMRISSIAVVVWYY